MKKLVAMLLVLVLAVSMFAACETGKPSTNNKTANFVVPEGGYDGSAVTITFYHTMGANLANVLANYIVEFNKLYPNITIEHS